MFRIWSKKVQGSIKQTIMKKTAEETVNRLPRSSEYPLYVHESDVEQALEEYKDQHTAPIIEALEYLINTCKSLDSTSLCTSSVSRRFKDRIKQAETALLNAKI